MTRTNSRRLIANTVLNLTNQMLYSIVGFLLVGFFIGVLGEARYGLWILMASIFSYRSLLSGGLNAAVDREVSVYLAKGDHDRMERVVSTAFAYFLAPAVLIAVVTVLVYLNVGTWFAVPADLVDEAEMLALLVGFSIAIALPLQVYSAVLAGYQRYDLINSASIAALVLKTGAAVWLLLQGGGLIVLAIVYGLAEIGMRCVNLASTRRVSGGLSVSLRHADMKLLRSMFGYGVNTIMYMSGSFMVFQLAELALGAIDSTTAVGRFHVAAIPVLLLITLIQVFTKAMKPAVSDLDARSEDGRIEEMALLMQKYTVAVVLLAVVFLLVMGESFFTVWVGGRFEDPGAINELTGVLQALAVGAGARLTQHSNFITMVGKGEHAFFGRVGLATIIVAGVFSVATLKLVPGAGPVEVAWASAIPLIVASVLVVPIHFYKRMGIGIRPLVGTCLWPALVAAAPGCILLLVWKQLAPPESWFGIVFSMAAAGLVSFVSAWFFAISPLERARLLRVLGR